MAEGRSAFTWRSMAPVVCFAVIGLAWTLSSPPGAGVDEQSHYVRMVGLGHGQLTGDPVAPDLPHGALQGAALHRVNAEAGWFRLPASSPQPTPCNVFDPALPYRCPTPAHGSATDAVSYHAHYHPGAYVLPALTSRSGRTMWQTIELGRLAFLLQNTALFATAIAALRQTRVARSMAAMSALVLSATPLLAFQSGTLAPNATETLASVAFLAAAIAAVQNRSPRWLAVAAALGAIAAWSRDLGAPFVILFAIVAVALDPHAARELIRAPRRITVAALIAGGVALIGALVWQLTMKTPLDARLESSGQLWDDLGAFASLLADSIGLLGWLNVPVDERLTAAWAGGWLLAVALIALRATRRARLVALAIASIDVIVNLYLISGLRAAGFAGQARFTLAAPIAVVVVLVTNQRATRRVDSTLTPPTWWSRLGWRTACGVAGLTHLIALVTNAHRHVNGRGNPIDFDHVAWRPGGGWDLALFVAALGCVMLATLSSPTDSRTSHRVRVPR